MAAFTTTVTSLRSNGTRPRVRAPELRGRGWLNTGGEPLTIASLRGGFTLLDFWTFCCINCLHVLDELREVEEKYADELVVVGVHSPKFEHEADPEALAAAVERYDVHHPVLDDPELITWQAYTARAWPTLVLVDPEGYVVAQYAGEGHAHAIDALLAELVEHHRARGTLQPGNAHYVAPAVQDSELRFPAKAISLADNGFLVADAGHHSLVELAPDAETVVRRIGSGGRGLEDGGPDRARFSEPNGLCLLPEDVAVAVGYDVVVADTVNHALRGVQLSTGQVITVAGSGRQWMQDDTTNALSSPWDVAWWQGRVWVAMAGIHQLWTFDPVSGDVDVAAGTGNEGLVDGPADEAWLAQPSGLAPDDDRLWIADAEVSALRWIDADGVHTAVGRGLFDFGFRDGKADEALLQHPMGVVVLPDGSIAIADTYNHAVRRYDPATTEVTTVATDLREVSGLVSTGAGLVAVESASHRLSLASISTVIPASGLASTTSRPTLDIAAGELVLDVAFTPPAGQKLDDRFGSSSSLVVESTPPGLLAGGAGRQTGLTRLLSIDADAGDGILHVAARAASCDAVQGEGAACRMHQQDWGVPVRITPDGVRRLELTLGAATTRDRSST